ncbi:MAG: 6-carboxytetrahydropterin synthase [Calditrichia bacterium]
MYSVSVTRDFIAQHFLFGGDWGAENSLHSHHYKVEVILEGTELDEHGYLVDIVEIERIFEELCDQFRDKVLNELPAFNGLNPSIEHFARIFAQRFSEQLEAGNIRRIRVKVYENEIAWAAYRIDRT